MVVEVKKTPEGRGLFAARRIRQGETIMFLPDRVQDERDMYSIEVFPGVHVDCSDSVVGALNHACKANAAVRDNRIVAWACIQEGEEITINYRMTETHLSNPFTCKR